MALAAMSVVWMGDSPATDPFDVTLGQPGVDLAFGTREEQEAGLRKNVAEIIRRADESNSQLLVLPEGIAGVPIMPPRPVFPLPKRIPVIFGGERGVDPIYQSAFAYDGVRWQVVDKTRLVVFGEFVPGRSLLGWVVRSFRLPSADLTPGRNGVQPVRLAGMTIGPIVCFEALFPDVAYRQAVNGSRVLAVIGIDDWFMGSGAPDQLRGATVWRAVETGLPVVRATTTGYTMACDGKGRMINEAPLRRPFSLRVTVPAPVTSPLFHALPVFPLGAGLFAFAFPWLPRKNPNRQTDRVAQEK
jgi:apolipoprotein N-acyltransferase